MSYTFDIFSIKTVPSDYSWDKGTPAQAGGFTELVTDLSACELSSTNQLGTTYVGYAPFVSVTLSSDPGDVSRSLLALKRTANFGDYYNSDSNMVIKTSLFNDLFCHVYVMPGLYTITLERTEYAEATSDPFGACLQRHCINWSWKSLSNCTEDFSVTWRSTRRGNLYEKRWKFEPCEQGQTSINGVYIQKTDAPQEKGPLSWQWYNYKCASDDPRNTPTVWLSSGFQQPDQMNWIDTSGPCVNLGQNSLALWKWNNITIIEGQNTANITWDETKSSEPGTTTWDFARDNCTGTIAPLLSTSTRVITKEAYIRVLEIPPTAYLRAIQPENKSSPMTVRLSPRDTICGSFPIEKIVWDLGDGSPLLTQRRWSNTVESPFVYAGIVDTTDSESLPLSADYQDPRNYDVIHTYTKTADSGFCFYPSITAYASSTNSFDCAAAMVGPLKMANTSGSNFRLLQNELTDHGKILIGQIDNNVAVWRTGELPID